MRTNKLKEEEQSTTGFIYLSRSSAGSRTVLENCELVCGFSKHVCFRVRMSQVFDSK